MFTVYVIKSKTTGKIYIGYTADIEKRLLRHNGLLPQKKTSFTYKNKGPWELIYKEEFKTQKKAKEREKYLKSSRGRAFIKTILNQSTT